MIFTLVDQPIIMMVVDVVNLFLKRYNKKCISIEMHFLLYPVSLVILEFNFQGFKQMTHSPSWTNH